MSHKATNWAILQRGLKPATKLVLWYLCDRHNPDFGCFPSQAQLAADAELSASALNVHLRRLEEGGLIRRVQRIDPRTKRQLATRYILGFEAEFARAPSPECGDGIDEAEAEPRPLPTPESGGGSEMADSGFQAEPTPDFGPSRLRNPETNPVREPVKEEEDARDRERDRERGGEHDGFEAFFAELLRALGLDPEGPLSGWWQGWPAREHVRRWMVDFGFGQDRVLEIAKATRREHPKPPDGPRALDRAMEREARRARARPASAPGRSASKPTKRRKGEETPRASFDAVVAFHADWVNSDRFLPANTISNSLRGAMLAQGLVTEARLKARGVR